MQLEKRKLSISASSCIRYNVDMQFRGLFTNPLKRKSILFCDFDGTICFDRYWRSLPPAKYEKVQGLLFGKDTTRGNDWMRGKYTAEEINEWVSKEIGVSYEKLWQLFVEDCRTMRVAQETLETLSHLRGRYTVILMTGNMDSFTRFTVPRLNLANYFDYISNSYYEGKHKTDNNGKIFEEYAIKYDALLTECIVIDDSPDVCSTFERLGGKVCHITSDQNIESYLMQL